MTRPWYRQQLAGQSDAELRLTCLRCLRVEAFGGDELHSTDDARFECQARGREDIFSEAVATVRMERREHREFNRRQADSLRQGGNHDEEG
jgi:hypothetical protein